ncbi:murein transglycosylase A, partial [Craterilacuibacter sp.]|uniref:murein transglycosylase A n=1 Tax=Craterilacuibacter sp. TaxID=2870909 RepID=UPI003F3DC610
MKSRFLLGLPLLWLAACSSVTPPPTTTSPASGNVRYEQAALAAVPGWSDAGLVRSLEALRGSCRVLQKKPGWGEACSRALAIDEADGRAVRRYFEQDFAAWRILDGSAGEGLITGYYEPLLNGSRTQSARTPYPVYGVPPDLVVADVTAQQRSRSSLSLRKGAGNRLQVVDGGGEYSATLSEFAIDARTSRLKGRIEGNRFRPYYQRGDISAGKGVAGSEILAWVENPVELFFLQIQGSGRIQLEDGSMLRVGYAEQNGHPYVSIGRHLVDQGEMVMADASMQGIQDWIKKNPNRMNELFNVNPSYVFFRVLGSAGGGPLGALGVPLTDGYSIAVDPRFIPLGAPVFLSTTWPLSQQPLQRVMLAQDTGGAIRGAIRADFFWGFGTEAGMYAG